MRTLSLTLLVLFALLVGVCSAPLFGLYTAQRENTLTAQDLRMVCFVSADYYEPALAQHLRRQVNPSFSTSKPDMKRMIDEFYSQYHFRYTKEKPKRTIICRDGKPWIMCYPDEFAKMVLLASSRGYASPLPNKATESCMLYSGGHSQYGGLAGYGCFQSVIGANIPCRAVITFDYPGDSPAYYRSFDFGGPFDQQCLITALKSVVVDHRILLPSEQLVLYGGCKGGLTTLRTVMRMSNERRYDSLLQRVSKVIASSPVIALEKGLVNMSPKYGTYAYRFLCNFFPNYKHPDTPEILQERLPLRPDIPIFLSALPVDHVSPVESVKHIKQHLEACHELYQHNLPLPRKQVQEQEKEKRITLFVSDRKDFAHGFIVKDPKHSDAIRAFLSDMCDNDSDTSSEFATNSIGEKHPWEGEALLPREYDPNEHLADSR